MGGRYHSILTWYWWLALTASIGGGVFLYAYQRGRNRTAVALPADAAPRLTMDEDQRHYLWDVEHHGLLLAKHGFARLADALSRADGENLARLLAPNFAGHAIQQPREVRVDNSYVEITRLEDAGLPPPALTGAQFRERLLAYRQLFGKTPKVQLSLMALSPAERPPFDAYLKKRPVVVERPDALAPYRKR